MQFDGGKLFLSETRATEYGSAMLMRGKSPFECHHQKELRTKWLGHADARQVSDLPDGTLKV